MKLTFNKDERSYLNRLLKRIYALSEKYTHEDEGRHHRVVSKMKYKFDGEAVWVNLNLAERNLLKYLMNVREAMLKQQHSISDEYEVIKSITRKVQS